MAKTGKQKKDMRAIRAETAIALVAGGAVSIAICLTLVLLTRLHPLVYVASALLIYGGISAAVYFIFEKKRLVKSHDENLAPVMGKIMFDAVVKMSTPVFICDSTERIIWYNTATEALRSEKNKLYGEHISELFDGVKLRDIRNDRSDSGYPITSEGRSFLAKYNHIKTEDNDFALITTSETTELEALTEKMAGDETVVCYIIIDTLNEMLQYNSEQYKPASVKIDEILREWADEYGGILKEYERDKYIYITEARALDAMIVSKFDVLDRVRDIKAGETNLPLTISMGVSNIHGTFEEKDKAAHAALEMALQRGGDQVGVKGEGSIEFYGGVTKSVQKRTNVRARVISNELIATIKAASNVLIMGHRYADFDSFGSCVGIARLAMYCGAKVNIVINLADRNLVGCREMLENEEDYSNIFVCGTDALDLLETGTLVIVSDVNNLDNTEEPELAKRTEKLVVIDHHRKMSEFESEPDVEYIDPSASSTCELVAEMLEQVLAKEDISSAEANLMLAGITLDTKQFTKTTGTRTFSAAMYLRDRGASPAEIQGLFLESFDDYMREVKFRRNVEIYRDSFAITVVGDGEASPEDRVIAAKAADNLLMVDGIKASFAAITLGETVHLSARSRGKINVQLILEELGGGGHYDSAGVQCTDRTAEELVAQLKQVLDKYI